MKHIFIHALEFFYGTCGIILLFAPQKVHKFFTGLDRGLFSKEQPSETPVMKKSSVVAVRMAGVICLIFFFVLICSLPID